MPALRQLFLLFFFILPGIFYPFTGAKAGSQDLPFALGEEIVYNIRWQQIQAGTCSLKVLPFTLVGNTLAYHFQLSVKSNQFVDKFYKIRDVLEGFVVKDFSGSILYKQTSTGKRKKQILVEFFWDRHEVVYSNFGGKRDPIEIPGNTFDPVGSFYRMRTLDFEVGKTLSFPVTDGKKCFLQKGDILEKEKITTPSGTFDTFVLAPYVSHFSGVFKKSQNPTVRVWITDDEKKIPVRIQIKVVMGSIIFDLVSVKGY
jgi:hypothetical protein